MTYKRGRRSRLDGRLSIPEFFADRTILITGATGFMGKAILEKILRSCPDVKTVYILMRPKKGKTIEERLKIMTALPVFVKVRRQDEKAIHKIVALKGDVSEPMLGLSEEDQKLLEEVSVVFHVAASVRFDDPLKKAVLMNTRGTYEMIKLAMRMKNLETFLHVSTTYCNTHKDVIEESVYPVSADWRQIIKIAESMDEDALEVFCEKILGPYPNTYTFTKGLAEHVVLDHAKLIPCVICRPSIVVSSVVEPLPGWVDNFNGPVGLIVASGKGIIKSVYTDPDIKPDYIPVDLAVKAMIIAVWNRATSDEDFSELPVYNCSADKVKRITQKEMFDIGTYVTSEVPLNDILWVTRAEPTKHKYIHYIKVFFFHILPALFVDTALKIANKKPMLMKIQRKIFLANLALEYFLTRQWTFKHDRCYGLNYKILEEDIPDFSFFVDGSEFDVVEYYRNCAYGARAYLLNEDNTELPQARKHQRRMYWIDKITKVIFLMGVTYLAIKFQFIQEIRVLLFHLFSWFTNF